MLRPPHKLATIPFLVVHQLTFALIVNTGRSCCCSPLLRRCAMMAVSDASESREVRGTGSADGGVSTSDATDATVGSRDAPLLLFDLGGFHDLQDAGDADALARQLMLCYSSNRRAAAPFRIGLCGLGRYPGTVSDGDAAKGTAASRHGHEQTTPAKVLLATLEGMNFRRWGPPGWVTFHEQPPWEAFPGRQLLYLR
jgi:hypothetical protein